MPKTYVDTTLVTKLRELGLEIRNLWEMPGPKGTRVAWMSAYMYNGRVFIVQTYTGGQGWEVYTASNELFFDKVVEETIARLTDKPNLEVDKQVRRG